MFKLQELWKFVGFVPTVDRVDRKWGEKINDVQECNYSGGSEVLDKWGKCEEIQHN